MNKIPTKSNKIVFIKNNMLDLIPITKKIKAEETEKDKIIEAKLKRIAKQIDPDNTFLNECEDVIKNRFSKTEKEIIEEMKPTKFLVEYEDHGKPFQVWEELFTKLDLQKALQSQKQKIIEEIEKIDTQIPDDDGIPVDILAEEFKKELQNSLEKR